MTTSAEGTEFEKIRSGDRAVLKELYRKHRSPFFKWAERRYSTLSGEIPDVYQQAFTIFYFNVKNNKFTGAGSSIQTYLFGIGKNLLNKRAGLRHNQPESLDDIPEVVLPTSSMFDNDEISHQQMLVKSILDTVGEPCKTILIKYYFENFSMEAIAENMGYKTSGVAKKKKCECLIRIREAMRVKRISINEENE